MGAMKTQFNIIKDGVERKVFIGSELKYVADTQNEYENWLLARNFILGYASVMYGFFVEDGEDVQES